MPILGHVIAHKAGHDLHNKLARAILNEVSSRKILVPSAKEASRFKSLLSFPKSLDEIQVNLGTLAIG